MLPVPGGLLPLQLSRAGTRQAPVTRVGEGTPPPGPRSVCRLPSPVCLSVLVRGSCRGSAGSEQGSLCTVFLAKPDFDQGQPVAPHLSVGLLPGNSVFVSAPLPRPRGNNLCPPRTQSSHGVRRVRKRAAPGEPLASGPSQHPSPASARTLRCPAPAAAEPLPPFPAQPPHVSSLRDRLQDQRTPRCCRTGWRQFRGAGLTSAPVLLRRTRSPDRLPFLTPDLCHFAFLPSP